MKINKENLLRMADYIETVPQEKFNMEIYRTYDETTHECNSIGCVIGHCTILDKRPLPKYVYGTINFRLWSKLFTGIESDDEWNYLFDISWHRTDNTPTGAAKRIRWFVEHGLPNDWEEQMFGEAPLPYNN